MKLRLNNIDGDLRRVVTKVEVGQRITTDDALLLYTQASIPLLGLLASCIRRSINGNEAYYNRNFHIEPTNICSFNCRFCSYHKSAGSDGAWEHSPDEIMDIVKRFDHEPITEVHIVGGAHPEHDLYYYADILRRIKTYRPELHIKAYSAIELDQMFRRSNVSVKEGLSVLKENGLGSIPGGGAEIFDEEIRTKICPEKASASTWLSIHESAHEMGISSNATMLYGHLESYDNRVDHLNRLRELQDKTGGFNAFIPLKYKMANNAMAYLGEVSILEDLKNYAVSRIFLDNIKHIKAYWPMSGREVAQISLSFGADDLDGTINDTTKIYSMAGAKEGNPCISVDEISSLITAAGFIPVERDSLYQKIAGNR